MVAVLLLQLLRTFADDVITNIVSPMVSYQYTEDFNSGVLSNGGIQSPFVSFQYLEDFGNATLANGGISSPFISYQYFENFSSATLLSGGVLSHFVSYQYFEWPGNDILHLQSSPFISYYYQSSIAPGSVALRGRVTDLNGAPLSDVHISARVYLSAVAQTTTDGNGMYEVPSLAGGVYDLWAVKANYQTSIRTLTMSPSAAEQSFQLKPMPSSPVVQQTGRLPNLSATVGTMGSALRVFDGTQFQPITFANAPSSERMTIVLTHGGASDPREWAEAMALKMWTHGITRDIANIVAWDWEFASRNLSVVVNRVPSQGLALGQALLGTLGPAYSHNLHFIGHSLGTMINAGAANYLHGDQTAQQPVSPAPWNVLVHVTMLDEASRTSIAGFEVVFDGLRVGLSGDSDLFSYVSHNLWQSALPRYSTWADNYRSAIGFSHHDAVNVRLNRTASLNILEKHSYAHQWYGATVTSPASCILGFKQSVEAKLVNLSTFALDQIAQDFPLGITYVQPVAGADPLTLVYQPSLNETLGNFAEKVTQTTDGVIEFAGSVVVEVRDAAQVGEQVILQSFRHVESAVRRGAETTVSFYDTAVLWLRLATQLENAVSFDGTEMAEGAESAPMVWLPISFPSGAAAMAFDFRFFGAPGDYSLVCGIGTNTLFSLEAQYIPTNVPSASPLIDVGSWAGTTNELFFGLLGTTATNAVLEIDNIRFYRLAGPVLNVTSFGNNVILSWLTTATGYSLESSDNLSSTNEWTTATNVPVIVGDAFVVTNAISLNNRFYRLRQ